MIIQIISVRLIFLINACGWDLSTDSSNNIVLVLNIRRQIKLIIRLATLSAISLLMLVCSPVQAESNFQGIVGLGITRANFDDQLVAGNSTNMEWTLGISYKSVIEFGYTYIDSFVKASMDSNAGIQTDGFYSSGKMFYLRGSIPLTESVDLFALVGDSKFEVKGKTYVCAFPFCGNPPRIDYFHEESGMALGVGMAFTRAKNRQLTIQYVDYNNGGGFSFKVFKVGVRMLFDLPI